MRIVLIAAIVLLGVTAMARNIIDRDRGYAQFMRNVGAVRGGVAVKVGILAGDAEDDHGGTTVLDVALVHEFGLGTAPERSFIRAWVDEDGEQIRSRLRDIARRVLFQGDSSVQEMKRFGLWAVGEIKKRIISGIEPGLAEATIRAKGSATPLVDTGQMLSSITSAVVEFAGAEAA